MGVRYMAKRMSLPSKKRKEGEEKQGKQDEPKQNEDPKSFVGVEAGHVCYPQTVLTRFAGEWENIHTLDFRLWSHNSSIAILGVSKSMQAIVANTEESNDQATATPAPAVSD